LLDEHKPSQAIAKSPIEVSDRQKTSATLLNRAMRQQRRAIFFHADAF